jgi:HK97 family phage major capsid protein
MTTTTERQKLTDRLASVTTRAQALLALADEESRDLSDAEQTDFEKLTRDAAKLKARIESVEVLNLSEEFLNAGQGRKTQPEGVQNSHAAQELDLKRKPPTYQNLFGKPAAKHEFKDLGDFAKAAIHGNDLRLMNANMSEDQGPAGGFLVPSQYSQALLDQALENEVIRPNANVIPMAGSVLDLPLFNYTDRTGAKRAGLQMVMVGEGQPHSAQSASTAKLAMVAKKGAVFVDVTSELESDTPNFSNALGVAMSSAIGGGFDFMFVQGTGAGQPMGIVNWSGTAVVSKEGSQAAATLLAANITKMAARLHPASWARATWLVSPSVLAMLLSLSQDVGPSSGVRAIALTQDAGGLLRIMGRPVTISDSCSALGVKGDVILADLSQYVVGLRKDISIERDISSGWKSDLIGFRTIVRFDGMPAWPSAVTPRAGVDTLSPFVVIETRA